MKNIIEIENLSKSFGDVKAVNGLSFCVKESELFAFLGVNGAGKSTTINIMCGMLAKDSGTVTIGGNDIEKNADAVKCDIGVVFQNSVLDTALSVYDNLVSRAALYGIPGAAAKERIAELAKPACSNVGIDCSSHGNCAFVEAHLRMMKRIFPYACGKAYRGRSHLLRTIGKILRAAV